MRHLKLILTQKESAPVPLEAMNCEQEKEWRVALLTEDERMAFQWFCQGYTSRWTAETMLLDRKTAKKIFKSVFCKLNVADEAEISRVYRTVKLTQNELPP